METWRIIATILLAVSGVMGVLIIMADVRERRRAPGGQVATVGAIAFTVVLVLGVLMLTVLPGWLAWGIVVTVTAVVGMLMLAG
ncbi:hypothetical protein CFN78_11070 [Amycolatopsis antarctica]|uniref:Major facilitator superfamily (MFS) profile domain-containing protein n=1 Tax=Amycolatopsis antarctica TaxID=1854586 RepID=A0A263D5Z3_9PSEU|nr:hypothetical protein [Amycolatopsis antarctica]OZM73458.1 hypothetical protein CFN78_11070 [Amycolatopsis antarctica]